VVTGTGTDDMTVTLESLSYTTMPTAHGCPQPGDADVKVAVKFTDTGTAVATTTVTSRTITPGTVGSTLVKSLTLTTTTGGTYTWATCSSTPDVTTTLPTCAPTVAEGTLSAACISLTTTPTVLFHTTRVILPVGASVTATSTIEVQGYVTRVRVKSVLIPTPSEAVSWHATG
jgi:hypothetical protein